MNSTNAAGAAPAAEDFYSSREGAEWEAAQRPDPVVWGSAEGPLDREELDKFSRQGFRFEEQLFDEAEVDRLQRAAQELAETVDPRQPGVIAEPASDVVRSVFRIHRTHDLFRAVCKDPRIVNVVRQLLGSDVYVHQSRINYKPAFNGKEFFWHSDFETWHIEDGMPRPRAVSVSLNLTDNNEFNGPLMVVPGSHRTYVRCVGETPEDHYQQSLRRQEYGVPAAEALRGLVDRGGITAPKGGPGSALFFECNLMHGSTGNLSPYPRTNLFLVYNSVENAVVAPFGGLRPRPEFLSEREVIPVGDL